MSQTERASLYAELKAAGVIFDKHFRDYSVADLQAIAARLHEQPAYQHDALAAETPVESAEPQPVEAPADAMAGEHAYTHRDDEVIRVDAEGRQWYREEVLKPAIPSPRKRRVLTYIDSGVERRQVANGQYIETFEVAGEATRTAEVKITMPSYQVGVFKDPRFPFRIHTYAGKQGFDYHDVINFYGGSDMVPAVVKTTYVANDLCYDIRSVVRAIEAEYNRNQMKGMN